MSDKRALAIRRVIVFWPAGRACSSQLSRQLLSDSGASCAGASILGEVLMPREAVDGWSMRVEVFALSAADDTLMFRHVTKEVPPGESPDDAALELAAT